jgi:hypothetical protein
VEKSVAGRVGRLDDVLRGPSTVDELPEIRVDRLSSRTRFASAIRDLVLLLSSLGDG